MSHVDIYTTTIEETGEVILDAVWLTDPYPFGVGKWLKETKFNKNIHGSLQSISGRNLPTGHLIKSAMDQHQIYRKNLKILRQELVKKVIARMAKFGIGADWDNETDWEKTKKRLGDDFVEAWFDLEDFLGDFSEEPYREGYLTDIFRYWRTVAHESEIRRFEDLWVYVAGRPHRQE